MKPVPTPSYADASDPDAVAFEELLAQLLAIRADLLAREEQLAGVLGQVPEENRVSARNFIHYAALRSHGGFGLGVLTLVLAAIVGILVVAVGEALHGWDHVVVLGALFVTAVGLMIAIAPNRRS